MKKLLCIILAVSAIPLQIILYRFMSVHFPWATENGYNFFLTLWQMFFSAAQMVYVTAILIDKAEGKSL